MTATFSIARVNFAALDIIRSYGLTPASPPPVVSDAVVAYVDDPAATRADLKRIGIRIEQILEG